MQSRRNSVQDGAVRQRTLAYTPDTLETLPDIAANARPLRA